MLIHHDKKRWARDKNAADRPVTLSKPAETINSALALTLHNGLHRRGHSSSMSHSKDIDNPQVNDAQQQTWGTEP